MRRDARYWVMNLVLFALVLIPLAWTGAFFAFVVGDLMLGGLVSRSPLVAVGMVVGALAAWFPALLADRKGFDAIRWWLYGAAFWPLAMIHAAVMPPTQAALDADLESYGRVPCHFCAERIRPEARLCSHCGREQPPGGAL